MPIAIEHYSDTAEYSDDGSHSGTTSDEHLLQQIIIRWTPAQVRKKIRDSVGKGKPFASKKAFAQAIHVAPSSLALFLGKTGSMSGKDSSVFERAGKYFIREETK